VQLTGPRLRPAALPAAVTNAATARVLDRLDGSRGSSKLSTEALPKGLDEKSLTRLAELLEAQRGASAGRKGTCERIDKVRRVPTRLARAL